MTKPSLPPAVLADRLKTIRVSRFGKSGAPVLAMLMKLPLATWLNYESGCVIPGHILLDFIRVTKVSPDWLLTGEGDIDQPQTDYNVSVM